VAVPDGAVVHDVSGRVLIPGLVDTHSHIGSTGDLNEMSGPLQPQLSAIDAIDPTHPSLHLARAGGLTTVNVMPGSGNLVGGQTAYLKLRRAPTIDELLVCRDRRTDVCGGLKLANGTNPQGQGAYPRTRMASAQQVRALWTEAAARRAELDAAAAPSDKKRRKRAEAPPTPEPDPRLDPLVEALRGERIVHHHTHRADDIVTVLDMVEQFGFRVVLHHVSEAWKVADAIAADPTPCSLIVIDSPGGKEEALEIRASNAAVLADLGVPVALHTDDPITDSRWFLRSGGLAIRDGLSEEAALAALTLRGAEMLGLDDRVGSLEVGKDADLVVLSGAPFSVWTHVLETWVEGTRVFDRADPDDARYATGGYDVADRYPGEGR
jgi:imidazolonepropionase-like amidohydrolase